MTNATSTAQRLTCAALPQANNLWRMKGLLQAALGGNLLQRATIDSAFDNSRDRQYYMDAMSKTLGWVERSGDGYAVTASGAKVLQAMSIGDATFAHLVHADLLVSNHFYADIANGVALATVGQALATEFGIADSTAERRALCLQAWFSDLQAARLNNTQPILAAKIAARSHEAKSLAQNLWAGIGAEVQAGMVAERTFVEVMEEQIFAVHGTACLVSGVDILGISMACRIKPLDVCREADATDLHNGLVLEARLATLFERGLITFMDDGLVKLSSRMSAKDAERLGLRTGSSLRVVPTSTMQTYLGYHRANVFVR